MSKRIKGFIALLIVMSFSFSNLAFAEEYDYQIMTDSELLSLYEPYLSILQSLNEKHNTNVQIASDEYLYSAGMTKRDVYIATISKSLDQFESDMMAYIKSMSELENIQKNGVIDLNDESNSSLIASKQRIESGQSAAYPVHRPIDTPVRRPVEDSSSVMLLNDDLPAPRMVPVRETQYLMLPLGGGFYLDAYKAFHPTLSYTMYGNVVDYGSCNARDGSGFYHGSGSYSRSSDSRYIYAVMTGYHIDKNGYCNLVSYTYSYTFQVGDNMPWR